MNKIQKTRSEVNLMDIGGPSAMPDFPLLDLSGILRNKINFTIELSQLIGSNKVVVVGGFEMTPTDLCSNEKICFFRSIIEQVQNFKKFGLTHLFITVPKELERVFSSAEPLPSLTPEVAEYVSAIRSLVEIAQNQGLKGILLSSLNSISGDFDPAATNSDSERLAALISEQLGDGRGVVFTSNFNTASIPLPLPADKSLIPLTAALSHSCGAKLASIIFLDQGSPSNLVWQHAINPEGSPLSIYVVENSGPMKAHFIGDKVSQSADYVAFLSNK